MAGLRRLSFVIGALALAATGLGAVDPGEMALGNPTAKVTVVEYASLSCPHCALFHTQVFPAFKKKYIDTGKVHFIYREFLTDPVELSAAAAVTARCAGRRNYFKVIEAFFGSQAEMYRSGDARKALLAAGQAGGLSEKAITSCLSDKAQAAALNARVKRHIEIDKISGTPTFVINGKVLEGDPDLKSLDAAIEPLLRR